jgi:hypothetical protein
MRYDRVKLIEKAKPYFKSEGVNKMFATEDGNMFYENAANYAKAHANRCKVKLFTITKEDIFVKSEPKKEEVKDENKELSVRDKAKELGLKVPGRASNETIQKMIDEHLAENKTE